MISSPFGTRVHPVTGKVRQHDGIDLPMPIGTPVHASAAGRVVRQRTDPERAGGLAMTIGHGNGWATYYAHLDRFAVDEGDTVQAGQLIAWSGQTGRVTGPHLHFGIYHHGNAVDPVPLLPRGSV